VLINARISYYILKKKKKISYVLSIANMLTNACDTVIAGKK
jgi:hypothetical protein